MWLHVHILVSSGCPNSGFICEEIWIKIFFHHFICLFLSITTSSVVTFPSSLRIFKWKFLLMISLLLTVFYTELFLFYIIIMIFLVSFFQQWIILKLHLKGLQEMSKEEQHAISKTGRTDFFLASGISLDHLIMHLFHFLLIRLRDLLPCSSLSGFWLPLHISSLLLLFLLLPLESNWVEKQVGAVLSWGTAQEGTSKDPKLYFI